MAGQQIVEKALLPQQTVLLMQIVIVQGPFNQMIQCRLYKSKFIIRTLNAKFLTLAVRKLAYLFHY
ncbi:hypothetical protein D3C77_675920 [compost metagenome]